MAKRCSLLRVAIEFRHALARSTDTTHVLMNNCYSDYAQRNAEQLIGLLTD